MRLLRSCDRLKTAPLRLFVGLEHLVVETGFGIGVGQVLILVSIPADLATVVGGTCLSLGLACRHLFGWLFLTGKYLLVPQNGLDLRILGHLLLVGRGRGVYLLACSFDVVLGAKACDGRPADEVADLALIERRLVARVLVLATVVLIEDSGKTCLLQPLSLLVFFCPMAD